MIEDVFACLVSADIPLKIVKARYDADTRIVAFRKGFNIPHIYASPSEACPVPLGVKPYPFKKRRGMGLVFLVDLDKMVCCNHGETMGVISETLRSKIQMLVDTWFFKIMGKRRLDLVELLITLGAGYGFFRFAEYILTTLFSR